MTASKCILLCHQSTVSFKSVLSILARSEYGMGPERLAPEKRRTRTLKHDAFQDARVPAQRDVIFDARASRLFAQRSLSCVRSACTRALDRTDHIPSVGEEMRRH